jgi:hypothetical protein
VAKSKEMDTQGGKKTKSPSGAGRPCLLPTIEHRVAILFLGGIVSEGTDP